AMSEVHHPKIESYESYLYLILHGIRHRGDRKGFHTQDVDFSLGQNYLVTVRHAESTSVDDEMRLCASHADLMANGPANLLHRIVDKMVDHYRPEVDALEERLEKLEHAVFEQPRVNPL